MGIHIKYDVVAYIKDAFTVKFKCAYSTVSFEMWTIINICNILFRKVSIVVRSNFYKKNTPHF